MGVSLYLSISDGSEDPEESINLSKRFYEQVICDWKLIYDASEFLTKAEREIINPNEEGQIHISSTADLPNREEYLNHLQDIIAGKPDILSLDEYLIKNKVLSEKVADRERDPLPLRNVLKKMESYFRENKNSLPLIHELFHKEEDIGDSDKSVYAIEIQGIKAHVEGDLYFEDNYPSLRNKIRLKSYAEDSGKIDVYLDVQVEMEIERIRYVSHTRPIIELFEQEFKGIYTLLERAIAENKKVLWEFS